VTALRAIVAALIGLVGLAFVPSPASGAVNDSSLVVNPMHGSATTSFTLTYRYTNLLSNGTPFCPLGGGTAGTITFRGNGLTVGTAPITLDQDTQECVSTLTMLPTRPMQENPGTWVFSTVWDTTTTATYVLDGPAAKYAMASATPTTPATRATTGSATPRASTSGPTLASASADQPSPILATTAASTVAPGSTPLAVLAGDTPPASSNKAVGLVVAALVLAGGFGAWLWRRRRSTDRDAQRPEESLEV
jgi:hypothetical protein